MILSLSDAARMLGQSERQVRYAIKNGRLEARRVGGRWVIDDSDLPLSPGQVSARTQKGAELRDRVEDALGVGRSTDGYSVRSLDAFVAAARLAREIAAQVGAEHLARQAAEAAVVAIAQGCHRFGATKVEAWRDARDLAAAAVAHLHVAGDPQAIALADRVEAELIPSLVGLVRRAERRRTSGAAPRSRRGRRAAELPATG